MPTSIGREAGGKGNFVMIMLLAQSQYTFRDPTRFGEYSTIGSTNLNPVAVILLLVVLGIVFTAKRRLAVIAAVGLVMFIPSGQRIVLATVDLAFMRILAIAFGLRILLRSEGHSLRLGPVDALATVMTVWPLIALGLRGGGEFMNALGLAGDRLLLYFAGRALIRDRQDVLAIVRAIVLFAIPIAVFFAIEKATARNFFAVFGGVSPVTQLRNGALRAQGAFSHPILAGTWWAVTIPLILALRWSPEKPLDRAMALLGVGLAMIIVLMSASSTPFAGVAVAFIAWGLFRYRAMLGTIWKVGLCLAVMVHLIYPPGLHHLLMARFTIVSGSTGVHRYRLIDAAINRVTEWGLFGGNTTYHWGWGLDDVTCEYVAAALAGGLLQLGSLVAVLVLSWGLVGKTIRRVTSREAGVPYALGASLAAHAACFLAVTYFGQINLLLWMTVGATQTLCGNRLAAKAANLRDSRSTRVWNAPVTPNRA